MIEQIFSCVEARAEEHKQLLKDMVCLESYTPDKADVDALGRYIRDFAQRQGFRVQVHPFEKAGDGLLITCNEGEIGRAHV